MAATVGDREFEVVALLAAATHYFPRWASHRFLVVGTSAIRYYTGLDKFRSDLERDHVLTRTMSIAVPISELAKTMLLMNHNLPWAEPSLMPYVEALANGWPRDGFVESLCVDDGAGRSFDFNGITLDRFDALWRNRAVAEVRGTHEPPVVQSYDAFGARDLKLEERRRPILEANRTELPVIGPWELKASLEEMATSGEIGQTPIRPATEYLEKLARLNRAAPTPRLSRLEARQRELDSTLLQS